MVIYCRECEKPCPDTAVQCPHCGHLLGPLHQADDGLEHVIRGAEHASRGGLRTSTSEDLAEVLRRIESRLADVQLTLNGASLPKIDHFFAPVGYGFRLAVGFWLFSLCVGILVALAVFFATASGPP